MTSVLRRTVTGVAIGAGVAGAIALDASSESGVIVWIAVAIAALGAALEASALLARRGPSARVALCAGAAAALVTAWLVVERGAPAARGLLWTLALPYAAAFAVALVLARGRIVPALYAAWVGPPLALLAAWTRVHGHDALIALIVLSKVGDVAGYFVGRRFGKRRPFPRISPGKTVAGCVASLCAGVAAGAALGAAGGLGLAGASEPGVLAGALLGAALNLAAQAGDLLESRAKRRAGAKDSGALMGASGGVLDVVDSLLLTVPAAWIAAAWLA